MPDSPPRTDLLREIEDRQDQVLADLEALEQQLQSLLAQYGGKVETPRVCPAEG